MKRIYIAYANLFRSIGAGFASPNVRVLLSLSAMVAVGGAIAFTWLEEWTFFDALYFCVVTMATVGYGDVVPVTDLGKIFTICFLFVGIGFFVLTVSTLAQTVLEDFRQRREK